MKVAWIIWLWILSVWNVYADIFLHYSGFLLWLGGGVVVLTLLTTIESLAEWLP